MGYCALYGNIGDKVGGNTEYYGQGNNFYGNPKDKLFNTALGWRAGYGSGDYDGCLYLGPTRNKNINGTIDGSCALEKIQD